MIAEQQAQYEASLNEDEAEEEVNAAHSPLFSVRSEWSMDLSSAMCVVGVGACVMPSAVP